MEMLVEAEVINRLEAVEDKGTFAAELHGWTRLFSKKYIDRVLVGIMMMFFQRANLLYSFNRAHSLSTSV
jgi:hypothetical protein